MEDVVITSAVRTAAGRYIGALRDIPPEILGSIAVREAIHRSGIDPGAVDEIIMGNVLQTNDAPNLARVAALWADVPITVPAYTVHRQCGSGLQAVVNGAMQIQTGNADIVVAGGAESMTRAPYYFAEARLGFRLGHVQLLDPFVRNSERAAPPEKFGAMNMGLTAENLAEKYHTTRQEQDAFAVASHQKAVAAIREGRFKDEIVPVPVPQKGKEPLSFDTDEHPRPDSSLEGLGRLSPAFKKDGTVTPGNSSGMNDAAAAVVLMSATRAAALGLTPMARVVSFAAAGVEPSIMGIGPVPACQKALDKARLTMDDIDLVELNEAFAAQALAVLKEWRMVDDPRVNVNGGGIALGHPLGATGAKLLTTIIHELRRRNARYGLVTLCIGGGMGIAAVVERV
ncbi:MAG TPA: acetyl-CoA C-acetyltransferase [Bacillota bacterium]|jgi:acetyl-CoA C-acetyltransferase